MFFPTPGAISGRLLLILIIALGQFGLVWGLLRIFFLISGLHGNHIFLRLLGTLFLGLIAYFLLVPVVLFIGNSAFPAVIRENILVLGLPICWILSSAFFLGNGIRNTDGSPIGKIKAAALFCAAIVLIYVLFTVISILASKFS